MALNTRSTLDPRWPFHQRSVVAGLMLARVEIAHPNSLAMDWNPAVGDVFDGTTSFALHYRGPARIQPNNDWRARKQKWDGQVVTEHAVRIQIGLDANEVTNPDPLPDPTQTVGLLHVNDVIRVVDSAAPYGHAVDSGIESFTYIVRNISMSSNSWVRTLLADIIVNDVSGGEH